MGVHYITIQETTLKEGRTNFDIASFMKCVNHFIEYKTENLMVPCLNERQSRK